MNVLLSFWMNWHRSVYSWFMFVSFGFGTKLSPFVVLSECPLLCFVYRVL